MIGWIICRRISKAQRSPTSYRPSSNSTSSSCRRSTYHAVMVGTDVALDNQSPVQACPWLEQGAGAKENTPQTDTRRTPRRASASHGLERVRKAAKLNKEERFAALLHHVDIALLRQAYFWLKPEAAPGVDGVRWQEYGQGLENKLKDLHGRVHRGATGRCRRGGGISPSRMDDSALWASPCWRTRSSSARWSRC